MNQAAFGLELRQTLQGKAENAVIQPAVQRDQWLQDLLRIKSIGAQSLFDYNPKKRYEVLAMLTDLFAKKIQVNMNSSLL